MNIWKEADAGGAGQWGGDANPAEEPQALEDRGIEPDRHKDWNPSEDYQFVYANGQFHISEDHTHEDMFGHAGVPDVAQHTGPVAVGRVHVDMGKATFEVSSNIGAQAMARVLKDYAKEQGWVWGGLTDAQGEPVGTGSEFAPVKSYYFAWSDDGLKLARKKTSLAFCAGAAHVWGKEVFLAWRRGEGDMAGQTVRVVKGENTGKIGIVTIGPTELGMIGLQLNDLSYPLSVSATIVEPIDPQETWVEHPDPWMDNEPGATTFPAHWGKVMAALREWAEDSGYHFAGNDNVMKRIEDLEENNTYTPEWNDEDDHFMFQDEPNQRKPGGVYKCPECARIFHSWGLYLRHRNQEEPAGEDPTHETEWLDMDVPNPPHFHEQPSFTEAAAIPDIPRREPPRVFETAFGDGSGRDMGNYGWRRPIVWLPKKNVIGLGQRGDYHEDVARGLYNNYGVDPYHGDQQHHGWLAVDPGNYYDPGERGLRMRTEEHMVPTIQKALIPYEPHAQNVLEPEQYEDFKWTGNTKESKRFQSAPKAPEGKDMLPSPVPFLYDIDEDKIYVGHPGQHVSDIPGQFTPGGIVEGSYEPGGKVSLRSMTNTPYTVRHLLELWYYQHPNMEIRSVQLEDSDGKRTKLASGMTHFHMAPQSARESIRQHGLNWEHGGGITDQVEDPETGELQEGGNFLFPLDDDAKQNEAWWGQEMQHLYGEPYDVWHVNANGLDLKTDSIGAPYSTVPIGPERLTLRGTDPDEREEARLAANQDIGGYIQSLVAADPVAFRASRALRAAGGKVFVVGGAVRDAIMGQTPKDLDLMVTGLPAEEVRRVLRQLPGKVVGTGALNRDKEQPNEDDDTARAFGVYHYREGGADGHAVEIALPRRERALGGGYRDFAVETDHTMTPEEDLYRRDFTVNAMAVDLDTGHLIDPFHGAEDAQNGVLRTLHTKSLADDPLRTMRALTAASRHGFRPDDDTIEQMRENAPKLTNLPADRIRMEISKMFGLDEDSGKVNPNVDPATAIRLARETDLLKYMLPEVDRAFGVDQNNPHHEHELGEHLVNVLERAHERKPDDPDFALAALLHDIGKVDSQWTECRDCGKHHEGHVKPCTACGSENTSGHFYRKTFSPDDPQGEGNYGQDHETVGAEQAANRLRSLHYPEKRIERMQGLIQHHMFPAFNTEKGARRFIQSVGDHADDLLDLRWADQGGKSIYPTDEDLSTDMQQQLVNQAREEKAPTARSGLAINGNDLIAAGMTPGPQMGPTLQRLVEEAIDNPELNTKNGLLGLVKGWGLIP